MSDRTSESEPSKGSRFDEVHQYLMSPDVPDFVTWCRELDLRWNFTTSVGSPLPTTLVARLPNTNHAHDAAYAIVPNKLRSYEIRRDRNVYDPKTTRYLCLWLGARRTVGAPKQHQRVVKRYQDNSTTHEIYTRGSNRWRWIMQQSAEIRDYLVQLCNAVTSRTVKTFIELEFSGYELQYVETSIGPKLEVPAHSHPDFIENHTDFYVELMPSSGHILYPPDAGPVSKFVHVTFENTVPERVRKVLVRLSKSTVQMNFDTELRTFQHLHTSLKDTPDKYVATSPYYIDIPSDINNGD